MKRMTWLRMLIGTVGMLLIAGGALAQAPAEGRGQRAEVRFLEGMIDHHQMALDMAQDCLAKAENEDVLALCQDIVDAQSAEIETMQGWLREWYGVDYAPMSMMSGHDAGTAMGGMGMMGDADTMGGMGMMGDADDMGGMMGDMMGHMSEMHSMMDDMMGHMEEMHSMMGGMMGHMQEMHGMMGQMGHMQEMHGMMGQMGEMGGMMGGMDQGQMGAAADATPEAGATVHDHETHTDVPVDQAGHTQHSDPPMMMGMMAGLHRLAGADYEVAWLESMIDHHDDAIHMAERILERAERDEVRALAETIIADQTAEIAAMEGLLAAYEAE